jgi:hypothetical protein
MHIKNNSLTIGSEMTNTITLTIDENNNIRKESKYPFGTREEAKECYREGQLAIRKCARPDVEEMILRGNALRNLQENIEISLNKLKNSVSECNINIVDIASDITKNLTIINERKRVGLLIDVNQSKMDDVEKEFKYLMNEFIKKCDCKKM